MENDEFRYIHGQNHVDSADYYVVCGGVWVDHWLSGKEFPDIVQFEVNDDLLSLRRRRSRWRNWLRAMAQFVDRLPYVQAGFWFAAYTICRRGSFSHCQRPNPV